jgi:hypothetical protein
MTHRILLVLPPYPLNDCAKTAHKHILSLLQKSIICPTRFEASLEVHALNFGELETTNQTFQGDPIFEDAGDPLTGEICATTQAAQRLQLDRIRLVLDRWLPSGLVMDFPG